MMSLKMAAASSDIMGIKMAAGCDVTSFKMAASSDITSFKMAAGVTSQGSRWPLV